MFWQCRTLLWSIAMGGCKNEAPSPSVFAQLLPFSLRGRIFISLPFNLHWPWDYLADRTCQKWLYASSQSLLKACGLFLETCLLHEQKPFTCWMTRHTWPSHPYHLTRPPTNYQAFDLGYVDLSASFLSTN